VPVSSPEVCDVQAAIQVAVRASTIARRRQD